MSTDPSVAREGWSTLRHGRHEASELEIPTRAIEIETGFGRVRLALGENGEARVLLPLSSTEKVHGIQEGGSLRVSTATYSNAGKSLRFLDMICRNAGLEQVFTEVVDEIFNRIRAGESCVEAARSTLEDFRELLNPQQQPKIDQAVIQGLVGELLFLKRLLAIDGRSWELWRGPLKEPSTKGERHDFRGKNRSIEVKTSGRTSNSRVHISSVDQLEAPAGGVLHLVHFVLEQTHLGPLSVGELATDVLAASTDPAAVKSKLEAMGCKNPMAPEWNGSRYQLEREATYEVKGGFPRIVAQNFIGAATPPGVSNVEYDIDLSVANGFLIEAAGARDLLLRMVECL